MALVVNYQKRKNAELFKSLEGSLLLSKIQNYIPIYNRFFSLNDTNYNSINLNHKSHISNVRKINDKFKCCIKSIERGKEKEKEKEKENVDIFFKMAPLLDPFKYLIGKYDTNDPNLLTLPDNTSTETSVNPKYVDVNNSAYVDGLFLYVTNFLLHEHGFINGVDYYGSFLAIKNDFKLNIFDDIDFLNESSFFKKNRNILYKVDDFDNLFDIDNNSVALKPIKIQHNTSAGSCISLKSLNGELFENMFDDNNMVASETTASETTASFDAMTVVELNDISCVNDIQITTLRSNSSCSSTSSHTNDGDDDTEEDNTEENNKEDSDTEWSDESSYTEEVIEATIPKFPVQVICMENCENTFDDLILNNELSNDEWFSALMQIIMILITYQKTFSFTHNDLHTNNVMYNQTDRKFIYYLYGKKYYKVPTFGRIFKVIDFGRSIYKVNGKVFCSDSFKIGGDAATQYNTEPFFNDKKARLDPNFSFDLCRLACSIYDYVIDDAKQIKNPVHKVIYDWCLDDNGCNLLYKNNGVERYPEFKLYKMIARCVHNHTPQLQLDRPEFKKYEFTGKVKGDIVDIDKMPVCV
jgi:hypothetical protein